MTKRGKGRPTALTKEVQDVIVAAIRAGAYVETAALFGGITKQTFYDWLKKASKEEPGQPHRDFSDAVQKAQVQSELSDVMVINKAAQGGVWQAAAWRLERKFPQRWGRRTEVELGETATQTLSDWLAKVLSGKG